MSNFKDFLRDAGYLGIGAVAAVAEAGSKAVKALVSKGEQTLRDNQDTVDEIKRKAKELGDKVKTTVEKATKSDDAPMDAASMTPEERAELRRQLDEADQAAAQPVEADAIYRTEEPVPEEETDFEKNESPEAAQDPLSKEESIPATPPVLEVPEEDDPRDPFTRF